MPRRRSDGTRPDWPALLELASRQGGHFTVRQAQEQGYSRQLLAYHLRTGTLERARRGIYRLAHYPRTESIELLLDWLWSEREGVFSHHTALVLHGLSDPVFERRHLSVPASWDPSQIRAPSDLILHPGLPPEDSVQRKGLVPLTAPLRTLEDCAASGMARDLLERAIRRGVAAGLFAAEEAGRVLDLQGLPRDPRPPMPTDLPRQEPPPGETLRPRVLPLAPRPRSAGPPRSRQLLWLVCSVLHPVVGLKNM